MLVPNGLAVLGVVLGLAARASAGGTTTTIPGSTTTTIPGSTTTTAVPGSTSTSTSSTVTTTTSTSSSTVPWAITACRSACQDAFDSAMPAHVDGTLCPGDRWTEFVSCWRRWGDAYHRCMRGPSSTCQSFRNGCMRVAQRDPGGCSDLHDCTSCCAAAANDGRRACRRVLLRGLGTAERDGCRAALGRLATAKRELRACRKACKRAERCGLRVWNDCVDRVSGLDACYGRCVGACGADRQALDLCLESCRNAHCDALERSCTAGGARAGQYEAACGSCEARGAGECRVSGECVQATTTTSTSSSSSSSTSIRTTTSTGIFLTTTTTLVTLLR